MDGVNVGFVTPVPDQIPPEGVDDNTVFRFTAALLTQIEYVGIAVGMGAGVTVTKAVSLFSHPVKGLVYTYSKLEVSAPFGVNTPELVIFGEPLQIPPEGEPTNVYVIG